MPYWNKLLALMAISALFSTPALADGVTGKKINRGPPPLEAKVLTPPREGCRLTEDGQHWACPKLTQKPKQHTHRTVHRKPIKTVRRIVKTAAPAPKGLTLDISGFNGGVGAGVDGGYYGGGGGAIILTGTKSFSGVTQHAAFRSTYRSGGKGKKMGGGCGC